MRGCDVGCPQGAIHNGWATEGRLMIVINRLPRSRQDLERTDDMHGRALGWARAEAALEVFEVCGLAVVLCDRFGKVLRLNDAAQGLLQDDLRIVQGRLVCANRETTLMLEQALPRLQAAGRGRAVDRPVTVLRAGRRPILVYPMRLGVRMRGRRRRPARASWCSSISVRGQRCPPAAEPVLWPQCGGSEARGPPRCRRGFGDCRARAWRSRRRPRATS